MGFLPSISQEKKIIYDRFRYYWLQYEIFISNHFLINQKENIYIYIYIIESKMK